MGRVRGQVAEMHYRDHAGACFGPLLRRIRVVTPADLDDLLESAVASGVLDDEAERDLRRADLIVRGRRREDGEEMYLVVEVSVGVGPDDVQRAVRRAALLGRVRPALAVVAGERATPEAAALARQICVWQVLDGHVVDPMAASS